MPLPIAEPSPAEPSAPEPSAPAALSCVIAGVADEHVERLVQLLGRSAHVADVERADDDVMLRHALAVRHRDLVVVVLEAPDRLLPGCLLRHPETRVLVVAPDGVTGTLARWLQQGANDLVSPHDDDALSHALGRMVDECMLGATARRLDAEVAALHRRIESLGARLDASASDDVARSGTSTVSNPVSHPVSHPVSLAANAAVNASVGALDTATRLPGRSATLGALHCLQARRAGDAAVPLQLSAVQVTLPARAAGSRLDRTLADLAACRAAEVLRRHLPPALVFGRTRRDTLLYVCAGRRDDDAADRLTRALGSLGELVEPDEDLRVDVLVGSAELVARPDLAERLERRAHDALVAEARRAARMPFVADERPATPRRPAAATPPAHDDPGTRAQTRYIGAATQAPEAPLDDSLVPILTRKSATARFARPAADAWP